MIEKISTYGLLILASLILISCQGEPQGDGWQFESESDPLSFHLTQNGMEGEVNISGGEQSSLFYITGQDTQYVTEVDEVISEEEDNYEATFSTTDQRSATVSLQRQQEGSLKLHFAVEPDTGVIRKGVSISATDGESYYGLMERVVDGDQDLSWQPGIEETLDLRGQKLTMVVKPTVSIYEPFYVSSKGYGVFVEGTWPGEYDMAASSSDEVSFSFEGPSLDVHFVEGPKPTNVVQNFHDIIGKPLLPPKWTFSVFHWRDEHHQKDTLYDGTKNTSPYNAELTEDILMLEALDIPFGVYWVDRPWAKGPEGYDDFEWDPERFPQAQQMLQWIQRKDKRFLLWIAPWIMGDMLSEAEEKGYLIEGSRDRTGDEPGAVRQLLDFSNPEAVEWWGTYYKNILGEGVDAFKLDRSEELMPSSPDIVLDNGNTAHQARNNYPLMYLKGAYEQAQKYKGDNDFLMMPRAAYTHSQEYGVFWGGDIQTGPWGLRAALIAMQRSAYMGFPVWGSDTGGYWGDLENYGHENLSRWLAFSCFSPIMDVGPLWNRAVWDMPHEPSYDPELIATYRLYATLHINLMDYSYQQAQKANKEGTPIVRPMSMAFPGDQTAVNLWNQYLYGPDILVGIIWENDIREFNMYLPEGEWTNAWSGETVEGPQEVTIQTPRHKIPIFVRTESDVDLGNLNEIYNESIEIAKDKPDLEQLLENEEFTTE